MSKRIDIKDDIYGDILVLDYLGHSKTHACSSCSKRYSYKKRWDIFNTLQRIQNVTATAEKYEVSRGLVYKINKELKDV